MFQIVFLLIAVATTAAEIDSLHFVQASSPASISNGGKDVRRSLVRSNNCQSSVDVSCTLDNSGLPCKDNLKVKRSDCAKADRSKIPVPVTIKWKYCNDDNEQQVAYVDKVTAKYKQWIKPDTFKDKPIEKGQCVELVSKKSINVCKRGAAMSMKYEAYKPNTKGSYCYSFKFLRIRKEWLPEGPCSVTTNVDCKITEGDKAGEDCSGNIIKSNTDNCKNILVDWQFTYCFWNVGLNQILNFKSGQTFAKIKGNKIDSGFDVTPLDSVTQCRFKEERNTINTCDTKTASSIQVQGRLNLFQDRDEICSSNSQTRVFAATQCEYNFIITQVVDPKNKPARRLVEIYTPNCAGGIITDDLFIIKYERNKTIPSYDNPISLKGLQIPANGFIVFCATVEGNIFYNGLCDFITMDGSAADSDGRDQVAIISGAPGKNFVILDIFGKVGEDGLNSDHDFQNGRVERKSTSAIPRDEWLPDEWIITVPSNDANLQSWGDVERKGSTEQPTKSPDKFPTATLTKSPIASTSKPIKPPVVASTLNPTNVPVKTPTFNPTMSPGKSLTFNPTTAPVKNSHEPTKVPIQNFTVKPTKFRVNGSASNPTKSYSISYMSAGGKGKGKRKGKSKGKVKGMGESKSAKIKKNHPI